MHARNTTSKVTETTKECTSMFETDGDQMGQVTHTHIADALTMTMTVIRCRISIIHSTCYRTTSLFNTNRSLRPTHLHRLLRFNLMLPQFESQRKKFNSHDTTCVGLIFTRTVDVSFVHSEIFATSLTSSEINANMLIHVD